jgi:GNAT superfamily N-acetyltransferase
MGKINTVIMSENKIYRSPSWARLWTFTDSESRGRLELVVLQNKKGSYGIIENVLVKEEFRNQGVASNLIKEAVETSKQKGFYKITLTCSDDLTYFYTKLGFAWHPLGQSHCMRMNLK